jgi:2-polyprenyl-6-methoxyphenol hydroxylase-like FAD-dependent oxidoreductase
LIYDVVIAGAGPVGLFLACELRLAGISVLVLERMHDTRTPLKANSMGMRGLNLPSVEAFYRRGLLNAVRESALGWMNADRERGVGIRERSVGIAEKSTATTDNAAAPSPAPRFAGHFAGIMLNGNKIDFSSDSNAKYSVGGPSASGGMVSLEAIESLLAERADELGVELRLGAEVTDLTQTGDGVTVHIGDEAIPAKWLVGCDGGRSTVRKRAGFDFPGTDPEYTGTVALAEFADPEKLLPGCNVTAQGMYVNVLVAGRISVVDFDGGAAAREGNITLESFQKTLRRISGTDVTVTALPLVTRYTDNTRQATTYRIGRILIAGDAAHVHSPLGGQGMNLGLGDAMNLGWKLAAVIKGWTDETLLDTYTAERHPIGAWALEWTRAQVAILRPEPHARAMAAIVREIIDTPAGATFFAQKIAGTWLRYDLPGDHPLIGQSAPDLLFEDGTRLGAHLHEGKALLLSLNGLNGLNGDAQLRTLAESWAGRLNYLSAQAKDNLGLAALLVRPDGFVAWATDGEPDPSQAAEAITRWLGPPHRAPQNIAG